MKPYDYQILMAMEGYEILKKHLIVYFAAEERAGKTLAALEVCEIANVQRIGILTKKKALDGWREALTEWEHEKLYFLQNYHNYSKLPSNLDLVILDEAHNYISGYPKPSAMWRAIQKITTDLPLIYISATPHAQGYQLLYHQLALSSWSPWAKYKNFYQWFQDYGVPKQITLGKKKVAQYTETQEERIKAEIDCLFVTKTRKELDFDHEPEDVLHYVELDKATKELYNTVVKDRVVCVGVTKALADSTMKMRSMLHCIEGGTLKHWKWAVVGGERRKMPDYLILDNTEKIDYIKEHWGDSPSIAIMYQYKGELVKLKKHFKHAKLLQATSNAEGVDLHKYAHLIIYSQDWSTARHSQRRARQANKNRSTPIKVHYLLVKNAISEQVYETVSVNKVNFVDSVFIKEQLC